MRNKSMAIFIVNDDARAVKCSYEPPDRVDGTPSTKLFKSLDQTIQKGDYVVVETTTRHGMTVVKVEGFEEYPDMHSSETVEWIVGVVRRENLDDLKAQEKELLHISAEADKRREREKMRKDFLDAKALHEAGQLAITQLPPPEEDGEEVSED